MVKLRHSQGLPDFRYYTKEEVDIMLSDGTIDHLNLSNIGINTHPQIDTHIADATIHFTEATIDHTAILNIGVNTHAQIDTHITAYNAHDHSAGDPTQVSHANLTNVTSDQHHAQLHSIASHNDTTATGAEMDTLTDNSVANTLHRHSELVASDGAPDPAVSVDADGIVSMPHQSGCRVRLTGDQTIGTGVWTKLQFGTEDFDIQGEFDNVTNYRFTAKQAGYYQVNLCGSIGGLDDGKTVYIHIYKNGNPYGGAARDIIGAVSSGFVSGSDIVYFNGSTDYIEGFIFHNHGADRTASVLDYANYMSIMKIA